MTRNDYIQAGYLLSSAISQDVVDRAEADVKEAYINPINATADPTTDAVAKKVLMQTAFTLILYRSIVATRSGAKTKTSEQSQTPDMYAILRQESRVSAMWVEKFAKANDALVSKVTDILGLYFETNYLGGLL